MSELTSAPRFFGRYNSPAQLISAVELQFLDGGHLSQQQIAINTGVDISTVLNILTETWGEPQWYIDARLYPHPRMVKHEPEPRGEYNVDHANGTLNCRVRSRDKAGWVKRAQKAGVSLAAWVVQQLNTGADLENELAACRSEQEIGYDDAREMQAKVDWLLERVNVTLVGVSLPAGRYVTRSNIPSSNRCLSRHIKEKTCEVLEPDGET